MDSNHRGPRGQPGYGRLVSATHATSPCTRPARFELATFRSTAGCSGQLSYSPEARCPPPTRRERERRPNGGSRVILRSRATLRRSTTGHLVDACTTCTACTSSAAFLPGPSLVKKRLLHLRVQHAARKRGGIRKRKRPTWHSAQVGRLHRSRIRKQFVAPYVARLPEPDPAPIRPDENRSPRAIPLAASTSTTNPGMPR